MRIALTGVSGFIGSELARHLTEAGHRITGLVRPASRTDHIAEWVDRFVPGDQSEEPCWNELLEEADCLIHNSFDWQALRSGDFQAHLRKNLLSSINLFRAAAPRILVFMSSVAVISDVSPRWAGVIDEDHPLRPSGAYGACKAAIEDHLWHLHAETGARIIILRPAAVYGIDPDIQRTIGYPILKRFRQERQFTRSGGGKFIHVEDVARATGAAIQSDRPWVILSLADCYARWADWARLAAEVLGIEDQVEIDFSSPLQSKNRFSTEAVASLGVPLNRGLQGIREHLAALNEHPSF